jgi:hypothetical protein
MFHQPGQTMPKIISANRLSDGLVVYLSPAGTWTEALGQAECLKDNDAAATRLARAREDIARNLVVDPFLVELADDQKEPRPISLRDQIRELGPTIDYAPTTARATARTARS